MFVESLLLYYGTWYSSLLINKNPLVHREIFSKLSSLPVKICIIVSKPAKVGDAVIIIVLYYFSKGC